MYKFVVNRFILQKISYLCSHELSNIKMTEIRSGLISKNNEILFDEDGFYIGPPSEYNENGIDSRTGEAFCGMRLH